MSILRALSEKDHDEILTVDELACALYEGTPHLRNLAEKCARNYGEAEALTFYEMMGDDVKNFWKGIALQIIDHSRELKKNQGSCCVLSEQETIRLNKLPKV